MTLAIIFALSAGFLYAVANIIDKTVLTKYIRNPMTVLPIYGLLNFLFGVILNMVSPHTLPAAIIGRIFVFSIFYFISTVLYFYAVKHEEVSRIIPLYSFSAVFMAMFEWLVFKERLALMQYGGIIIVVIGTAVLSLRAGPKMFNRKGLFFVLLSAIFWSLALVLLADTFKQHGFWQSLAFQQMFVGGFGMLSFVFLRRQVIRVVKESGKKIFVLIFSAEGLSMTATFIQFYAAILWLASLASAITSDQYIVVFLLSLAIARKWPHVLKEEVTRSIIVQKIAAITLIILGIFLISVK